MVLCVAKTFFTSSKSFKGRATGATATPPYDNKKTSGPGRRVPEKEDCEVKGGGGRHVVGQTQPNIGADVNVQCDPDRTSV